MRRHRKRKSSSLQWLAGAIIEALAVAALILLVSAGRLHRWPVHSSDEVESPTNDLVTSDSEPHGGVSSFDLDQLR